MTVLDAYPLGMLQAGMLFHSRYGSAPSTYQDILSMHVDGPLALDVLTSAIRTVVQRHPVLRTGFDLTSFSEPMQLVYDSVAVPDVVTTDLTSLADAEQDEHLWSWVEQEKRAPIGWESPPLIRLHVHRLGDHRHRVGLTFHHAILDGWSLACLVTELLQLVADAGDPALAERPAATMRDFVALERSTLRAAESTRFWGGQLEALELAPLPRWPSAAEGERESCRKPLGADLGAALHAAAAACGVPLRSVLLAAHCAVLRQLTGQVDVCTGLVTNGRPETDGGDRVLGLFLNTVPFRLRTPSRTWGELVAQVFATESALSPHRRYPLAQMLRDRRTPGQRPFDVAFDYRDFHVYAAVDRREPAATSVTGASFFERNDFPLTVSANRSASGLELVFASDGREFPAAQIDYIADHYLAALAALAGELDDEIDLAGLTPRGDEPSGGGRCQAPAGSIDELVREQAARRPDAVAVTSAGVDVSYRDLVGRADRVAAQLRQRGVTRGSLVGLCMERSIDMVVGLLGILSAGAAYVPLDPRYPTDRLTYMVDDAACGVVLAHAATAAALDVGAAQVDLVVFEQLDGAAAGAAAAVERAPDDLAYVIYTSGSTGRPKGVAVTHGNVVTLLRSMADELGTDEREIVLATTSLSFDIAALELFLPLVSGSRLVVVPDVLKMIFDASTALAGLPAPPTLMQATPSVWRQILANEQALPTSVKVLCGGEALRPDLAQTLATSFDQAWNVYGPTETTIWSSLQRLAPGRPPTLGTSLAGEQLHVLDDGMDRRPVGSPGELYIGGVGVARGYLRRPALTAQRFVPDPFGDVDGGRLYRTGDVARVSNTGDIEFLGRTDDQVKLRGHRIELSEVEAAILEHPSVSSAAVAVQEEGPDDGRLVAYVVLAEDARPPSDPRGYLASRLPVHMVPSAFQVLQQLPMTPNGKLDRNALPRVGGNRPALARTPVPPRTDLERKLERLWADALRFEAVGVFDRFFDLGGDSLTALRLLARTREELEVDIPASALFEEGTVAAVAEIITGGGDEPSAGPAVRLHPDGAKTPVFCVHPLGGHVFSYRELSTYLGAAGHPFYAFQAPGLESGEPMQRIEDLAAHYLATARAIQPSGPYLLTGWCMGGTIAFEMARQLRQAGEDVDLLAIISANANEPVPEAYANDDIGLLLNVVYGRGLDLTPHDLEGLSSENQLDAVFAAAFRADGIRQDIRSKDQLRRLTTLYRCHARASLAYRPGLLDAAAVLYRPSEGHEGALLDLGWGPLVLGRLDIVTLPGSDHYSMLNGPNGEVLAAALLDRIGAAEHQPARSS